jgi:hypothetical protein
MDAGKAWEDGGARDVQEKIGGKYDTFALSLLRV